MEVILEENETLVIVKDEKRMKFPLLWLRDNCGCAKCQLGLPTQQRIQTLDDLDLDITIKSFEVKNEKVKVVWNNNHESSYAVDWMLDRRFDQQVTNRRVKYYRLDPVLWGSEIQGVLPFVSYDQFMTDDLALYKWLCTMEIYGICKMAGVPAEVGTLGKIGQRVAYLRQVYFGEIFSLNVKINDGDVGNTSGALHLHTDLSSHANQPGMLMLHCIKQIPMEGGESQLADGFHAAYQLKQKHPDYYEILSRTMLEFFHCGFNEDKEFLQMSMHPIFSHDQAGNLDFITYANHARSSYLNISPEDVKLFYHALKTFHGLLYSKENVITMKLQAGELMCINNHRVLHGRTGWEVRAQGERHLEGGYIDWDEMRSARRVLQKKYKDISLLGTAAEGQQDMV